MKWALDLSEYNISFKPRGTMKGQAVNDFIVKLTPPPSLGIESLSRWTHNVDGSSNEKGSAARVLIQASSGDRFLYAIRLNFLVSNNKAEYESLISGLPMAEAIEATHFDIQSDLKIVYMVNQITKEYQAKDSIMDKYLHKSR